MVYNILNKFYGKILLLCIVTHSLLFVNVRGNEYTKMMGRRVGHGFQYFGANYLLKNSLPSRLSPKTTFDENLCRGISVATSVMLNSIAYEQCSSAEELELVADIAVNICATSFAIDASIYSVNWLSERLRDEPLIDTKKHETIIELAKCTFFFRFVPSQYIGYNKAQ